MAWHGPGWGWADWLFICFIFLLLQYSPIMKRVYFSPLPSLMGFRIFLCVCVYV